LTIAGDGHSYHGEWGSTGIRAHGFRNCSFDLVNVTRLQHAAITIDHGSISHLLFNRLQLIDCARQGSATHSNGWYSPSNGAIAFTANYVKPSRGIPRTTNVIFRNVIIENHAESAGAVRFFWERYRNGLVYGILQNISLRNVHLRGAYPSGHIFALWNRDEPNTNVSIACWKEHGADIGDLRFNSYGGSPFVYQPC